jgi:hypothetical protein
MREKKNHHVVLRRFFVSLLVCSGLMLNSSCTHFVAVTPSEFKESFASNGEDRRETVDVVYSDTKSHRFLVTHVNDEKIQGMDINGKQVSFPFSSIDYLTVERTDYKATVLSIVVGVPLAILVVWGALSDDDDDESF